MQSEASYSVDHLPNLMHRHETEGKSPREAAQAVVDSLALGSDNLPRVLGLVDAHRAELLKQRDAEDLTHVTMYEGDPLPPFDSLDGRIFRIGMLFDRLQAEYVRRQVAQSQATNDALPTAFDGDPKL